jgi:hypothetical protein
MISTRDVTIAAYIRYRGYDLKRYKLIKGREGEWFFDISKEVFDELKISYANSEFAPFEGIRRSMTKQKYK